MHHYNIGGVQVEVSECAPSVFLMSWKACSRQPNKGGDIITPSLWLTSPSAKQNNHLESFHKGRSMLSSEDFKRT